MLKSERERGITINISLSESIGCLLYEVVGFTLYAIAFPSFKDLKL